ncbi:MAG: hypothetical protein KME08_18365 [Aphanothece sp. CMT-3BRIN-NPC111]|jgi:type I restriction enzyme M protein|nr:hypothetical protein [Aphanothece sp. CMT-3BRIN-NPC111]
MAKETRTEKQLPEDYRWDNLERQAESNRLRFYKDLLRYLGSHGSTLVKEIGCQDTELRGILQELGEEISL